MMQKSAQDSLAYNSLLDGHLTEYYSSPQRRRHLRRMGLITRDGRLVDERTLQRRGMQKDCKKKYRDERDAIAAAILDEKQRQQKAELKKKLEALVKYETVQRIKREKIHPPGIPTYHPRMEQLSLGQTKTAPLKTPSLSSSLSSTHLSRAIERHKERLSFTSDELQDLKHLVETIEGTKTIVPSSTITPRPPTTPQASLSRTSKKKFGQKVHRRPSTAPTKIQKQKLIANTTEMPGHREPVVLVTLSYLGAANARGRKGEIGPLTEVEVRQQARGYTPLSVYKGSARPGEKLSFRSIRYPEMPFALTIYTNGMIDSRVSVCCEYRHRAGALLGGRSAKFKVVSIEGGSPCHLCQKAKEERKSKHTKKLFSETFTQSTPQLSSTLQSTQLEKLIDPERERRDDNSMSPASSAYSGSFHSDSSQHDDDEGGDNLPRRSESPYSLSENEHNATYTLSEAEGDCDGGITGKETTVNTDGKVLSNSLTEAGKDSGEQQELVTRAGVRIVYELGPVSTSECGTQTDEHTTADTDTAEAVLQSTSDAAHITNPSLPESCIENTAATDVNTRTVEIKAKEDEKESVNDTAQPEESDSTQTRSAQLTDSGVTLDKLAPQDTERPAPSSSNSGACATHEATTATSDEPKTTGTKDPEPTLVSSVSQENLPSDEQQRVALAAGTEDLDSISRSTLTQVSERDTLGTDSSGSRSSLLQTEPPQLSDKQERETQRNSIGDAQEGKNTDASVSENISDNQTENTGEGKEEVCEEEFTKAWT